MGVVALVAGGQPEVALRLAVSMTLIQFGIGALNDVIDAPRDRSKPGKPIPAGLVPRWLAALIAAIGFIGGLALSARSGPLVLLVAIVGVAVGLAYDLWLQRTPWAWLPLAIGIPLLPVYGWLGAAGELPAPFLVLVPAGAMAGAALALSNGLVDLERDRPLGAVTPAIRLGPDRALRAAAGLDLVVLALALGSILLFGGDGPGVIVVIVGALLVAVGLSLGRAAGPDRRERGWELQAVGIAVIGIGWVLAVAAAG